MNKPPILCDKCDSNFSCLLDYDGKNCRKTRNIEPTNADRIRAMTDEDDFIVAQACAAMGLDENGPAFWKEHIHVTKDIQSGEEIKRYKNGWYCSRCGKWSNYRAEQCSGCEAKMEADND